MHWFSDTIECAPSGQNDKLSIPAYIVGPIDGVLVLDRSSANLKSSPSSVRSVGNGDPDGVGGAVGSTVGDCDHGTVGDGEENGDGKNVGCNDGVPEPFKPGANRKPSPSLG